jgi:uncharacterized protein (TIGR01319 family)
MRTSETAGTILAADIGSVHTRVILVDLVDGQYRLIARAETLTTAAPPVNDVSVGLRRALAQMSAQIGRTFVNQSDELLIGKRGRIARFMTTASGGRPMKVVLVGLMSDVSIASGQRALASAYAELVDTLSLADIRTTEEQVNAILRKAPDLILIVGGTNDGASESIVELLKTARLAAILAPGNKPAVLYAGNEALKPLVRELFGKEVSLYIADNVRPALAKEVYEPVQLELGLFYGGYRAAGVGGFEEIQHLSELGVLPTSQSYGNVIRYLGQLPGAGLGVICVDVGSSAVTVTASVNKQLHVTIRPDLGVGHSAVSGVKAVGAKNIQRWLSFDASESDILDYAWNKTLRPSTVPETAQELEIEYAIARELIRSAVESSRAGWQGVPRSDILPAMRPIIGAGSILAQPINPGIGALLMLDALQPVGVVDLKLDPYGLIAGLGGIAYIDPLAVVQVLESGGLVNLGTAITPTGRAGSSTAMEVTVKYASGRTVETKIATGTLKTVPLPSGQKAQVTIKLGRGLRLNGKSRLVLTLEGGAAGLIFDGRGRPIVLPRDMAKRAVLLPQWYAAAQGSDGE